MTGPYAPSGEDTETVDFDLRDSEAVDRDDDRLGADDLDADDYAGEGIAAGPDDEDEWIGEDEPPTGQEALFVGDVGALPLKAREALVALLRRRYISADRHPPEWRSVIDYEGALRSRLNDQFLQLVVDHEYEVAYKTQAVSETGRKFPTLLYDQAYNREETILLLLLRREIRKRQKQGDDKVFVDRATLIEWVSDYRPVSATNQVRDNRSAGNAIDALIKNDILLRTKVEDRYVVSTIIEVLMPVESIKALGAWLKAQNTGAAGGDPDAADDTADGAADDDLDGTDDVAADDDVMGADAGTAADDEETSDEQDEER
jgi:hypothetical protein